MTQGAQNTLLKETQRAEASELPSFFSMREPSAASNQSKNGLREIRVLVVDDLLRDERDLSDVARSGRARRRPLI
jgi:hypothetical protein